MELSAYIELLKRQRGIATEALTQIACLNDKAANERLTTVGSYALFDEPDSVKIAREALKEIENTTTHSPRAQS